MLNIRIEHYDRIVRTPALKLAVQCWHELLSSDLIDDGASAVSWDQKAIVAFDDLNARAIGVLTYFDQDYTNSVAVALAYVLPGYRGMGVHTAMWQTLVEKAKELKRPCITSSTHVDNATSRDAMRSQGRKELGVLVRYKVEL
jgi:RimJ/RimL family protein N-acetyltransferase